MNVVQAADVNHFLGGMHVGQEQVGRYLRSGAGF